MLHSSHSCYSLTVYSPFWRGDTWIYINLHPKKSSIFPQKSRYIGIYRVILSKFSTPIPNFIVDPTPLFLRENKPRRFLEPCYCIMGRLVSQWLISIQYKLFCFLFPNIPHDLPHLTVQYPAKHVNRVGVDPFVVPQAGQLGGADAVLVDESILWDPPLLHHLPKPVIRNHTIQASLSTWIVTRNGVY